MNDIKYLRFWKLAVIVLVLCNIGLLATIWFRPHPPQDMRHGEQTRNYVISTLKFSDEQGKQYDALIVLHKEAMKNQKRACASCRTLFFSGIANPRQNPAVADSLASAVADCQKKIELVTYNHFSDVRKICTDAQKAEFDKIILDVVRKMIGNPGAPPPHGPGEPGGPGSPDDRRNGPPPPPPGPPENE